ncbi:helix-turn-helix domain-containing protein [Pseudomonas sp.]|uniref:helix-turn-helix domain-containing protein n=1 Tax=Pseudomonas sp. TaxID=306 RepID=UPI003A980D0D
MTGILHTLSAAQIAKQIREERTARGLSLVKLGVECGVHHSQLSRIEQGKIVRISKNVERICTYLQIAIYPHSMEPPQHLLSRVERLIASSQTSARAIESLVLALEELTYK